MYKYIRSMIFFLFSGTKKKNCKCARKNYTEGYNKGYEVGYNEAYKKYKIYSR